jgi:predicted nucleotidyltransferase
MHKLHLLLQRLADAGVEFVVIGGYAAVIHGSAYLTNDVDVCAVLSSDNVEKIRLSFLDHPASGQDLRNLYLETEGGIVDILSSVLGVGDFARLRERAVTATIFGREVSVISIDDLISAKEAVGREKDRLTVKELRAILAKRRTGNGVVGEA